MGDPTLHLALELERRKQDRKWRAWLNAVAQPIFDRLNSDAAEAGPGTPVQMSQLEADVMAAWSVQDVPDHEAGKGFRAPGATWFGRSVKVG